MVPADHTALLDDGDGNPHAVATTFRDRFIAAGADPGEVDEERAAWLSDEYGASLRATTPEAIVAKGALMTAITALLAQPNSTDDGWRVALLGAVDDWTRSSARSPATTGSGSAVRHPRTA